MSVRKLCENKMTYMSTPVVSSIIVLLPNILSCRTAVTASSSPLPLSQWNTSTTYSSARCRQSRCRLCQVAMMKVRHPIEQCADGHGTGRSNELGKSQLQLMGMSYRKFEGRCSKRWECIIIVLVEETGTVGTSVGVAPIPEFVVVALVSVPGARRQI